MTPAQERGLVIGKEYRVSDTSERIEYRGQIVKFESDDGDINPWFRVNSEGRSRCFKVTDLEEVDPSNGAATFGEEVVTTTTTTITVNRKLTDAEKRQIQRIIGQGE